MKQSAPDRFKNNRRETFGPKSPSGPAKAPDLIVHQTLHKRRRKARLSLRLKGAAGLLILCSIFFFSPFFKIKSVKLEGVARAQQSALETAAQKKIGTHFLFYGEKELTQAVLTDPYVKDATISATWRGLLEITLTEHVPEYALVSRGQVHLLDRFGRVLGNSIVIPEGMTRLVDDTPPLSPGNTMYGEGRKKAILTAYQELMQQNTSSIRFQTVNIEDPDSVLLEYNGSSVELGNAADLKNRLNRAINILKALKSEDGPVTIDLRFDSAPVIRRKGGL